ncbi:MAG: hemerythrin family protein [Gammaproteobacteria bacterium]|nr:hemerythrin family protein [Gammaproteobacteria bacterium]
MENIIHWSNDVSVGIQEIDEQHKVLFGMINELNQAIESGRGKEVREEIFSKLIEYTRVHFTVEESLMRILGYPDYEKHKQEHEDLTKEVIELHAKFTNEEDHSSYDLLAFLSKWLINHIKKTDKAYESYFIKMGVKRTWAKSSWLEKFWS